jgi:hypothetical protein
MANAAWETMHEEETEASRDFGWRYWTDVANWDDSPARVELDGPFAVGSRGLTRLPGQEPIGWIIREVTPGEAPSKYPWTERLWRSNGNSRGGRKDGRNLRNELY